ncbi:NADH:flavin oxidoreductase/NADH oxidase [Microbacterium chocolatum]|uniref:NADH:flavin oxidoreductase/NADH oxidase n=1 Tax=Microbacterium aurantiacum TaxID=162393 RepID=UPI00338DCA69
MSSVSHLFSPLELRAVTLPNRIGVSPMCMYSAGPDGVATDFHLVHLGSRAAGGAGLVFTEAVSVTSEGRITDGDLGLWNAAQQDALARIARQVRAAGAVPGIQLGHAGRKGGRTVPWSGYEPIPADEWGRLLAPSPLPFRDGWSAPTEMSAADLDDVVEAHARSARRAVDAGFDVIELHFAHGYLVHQFLSPLANHRSDAYGRDLEGRSRLAVRIAAAVRAEIGEDVALCARLSVVDWAAGGVSLDESVQVSRWLADAGVDLIDCSSGAVVAGEQVPTAPLYQVDFADRIRREAGIRTGAVGLITTASDADAVIREERADLVLIGRAMLRDPYWARLAAVELGADAAPPLPIPYRRAVQRMAARTQW